MSEQVLEPSSTESPLDEPSLARLHAYWHACCYLAAGMIYLKENPLLREPLRPEHIKRRLLGHWGASPGLSFMYVHINRLIRSHGMNAIFLAGPGHGAPGVLAPVYLEGTYSEIYPNKSEDAEGMRRFFRQFSFPGGIGSHCTPETPGSIHEGGELGYSLSHAFGAAFDNPDLVVAVAVGDGESETGPLATSWHSNKFLSPVRDGAVLPILHLNGYKINNPSLLSRLPREELDALLRVRWVPEIVVNGVAFDTPILGYGVDNTNLLRLWKSEASSSFDFQAFNAGDYYGAVHAQVVAENISKVLYPNDEPEAGKELRLKQQYFFVTCSLQDMIRLQTVTGGALERFHEKFAAQLNDTHPSIAVAELMRLLVDEHHLDWDPAWEITRNTFAYTNHTLLPEALETWPVELFRRLLPRHLEIIYEINRRFLDEVRTHFVGDEARVARMSLIDESSGRRVRMAHLASVGSYAINGVAALHTELLQRTVLRDFHEMWPDKISNKTNGVTPRGVIVLSNPGLAGLITERLGDGWIRELSRLRALEAYAGEAELVARWREVKRQAKDRLARRIENRTGVVVDPASLFDIQVKRIHEYKRQHLNVLHIVTHYAHIRRDPGIDMPPRTFVFGGKAAPGYAMAKLMIKLINSVGEVVNRDPAVRDRMRVFFFPDFNVKNAQHIYPAADLSEQISTAGMEASGTGNTKFAMNGALTIGTLDGANVEIREQVGAENFFFIGLTADEVARRRAEGYRPREVYQANDELREAIDLIASGLFSHGDRELFRPLTERLLGDDPYMLLADYASYLEAQAEVSRAYRDPARWEQMSILNVARMGRFSSDRAIQEYCDEIWRAAPCRVGDGCDSPGPA